MEERLLHVIKDVGARWVRFEPLVNFIVLVDVGWPVVLIAGSLRQGAE